MLTHIDHIAIVVPSIEAALPLYTAGLQLVHSGTEEVAGDQVKVAFFQMGESHLELVEPIGHSGVARFLERQGGGIHHVAFCSDAIEQDIATLVRSGVEMIDPKPRRGSRGTLVAFAHPKTTGSTLMELVAYPPLQESSESPRANERSRSG